MQGTIFGKLIKPVLSIFDVIIYYYYLVDNKTKYLGNDFHYAIFEIIASLE